MWVAVWFPTMSVSRFASSFHTVGTASKLPMPSHQLWTCLRVNLPTKDTDPGSHGPSGHIAERLWGQGDSHMGSFPIKLQPSPLASLNALPVGPPAPPFSLIWEPGFITVVWLRSAVDSPVQTMYRSQGGRPGEATWPL